MPKTIVIAGGGRNVGKTRLAEALAAILEDAAVVKIGIHTPHDGKNPLFFPAGTRLAEVVAAVGDRKWLVVESGSVLDDPDADGALVIFLAAARGDKPGSVRRMERAHLVRGRKPSPDERAAICGRMGLDEDVLAALIREVEAPAAAP